MIEHVFVCPCCWQQISMLLDLTVETQDYVEDCEVCCRPLQLHVRANARGELVDFEALPLE